MSLDLVDDDTATADLTRGTEVIGRDAGSDGDGNAGDGIAEGPDTGAHEPTGDGQDHIQVLPSDLLEEIIAMVPIEEVRPPDARRCRLVCGRWHDVVRGSRTINRMIRQHWRWEDYAAGTREPTVLDGDHVCRQIAVATDGTVFTARWRPGSNRGSSTISAWSPAGVLLRTLVDEGQTNLIRSLVVTSDGTLYSGSYEPTVSVWSGVNGAHLRTMVRPSTIWEIAVLNDVLYMHTNNSDAQNNMVWLWSTIEDTLLRTIPYGDSIICDMEVASDGTIYSSGEQETVVRVWRDGVFRFLEGHTDDITALALSPDGNTVYSASFDKTVRAWSGEDGTPLHVFSVEAGLHCCFALAIAPDGTVFCGSESSVFIFSGENDHALMHTIPLHTYLHEDAHPDEGGVFVLAIALAPDGQLWVATENTGGKLLLY